ncbi:MAG: hypothetical protein WCG91_01160 [Candidatus Shapirobacteria bacterium]
MSNEIENEAKKPIRFGKLKVLRKTIEPGPTRCFLTRCDCKNLKIIPEADLKSGSITSCGKCE